MNFYPKRLIEVDLPIKEISAHARREKSIRHGHISTLHIWWARRPLAACRAVLCAALWPDPADERCPQDFRDRAAEAIMEFAWQARCGTLNSSERALGQWLTLAKPENAIDPQNPDHLNLLRYALLDFIADFANWDNSTVPAYLETARALTQAAHEALGGAPGTRPLVVDPFAGGGAIPLEALRVGADAFASDLNPVAVLLNKVVLEYIPKYGQRLADEVRKWGAWIKERAEQDLAEFYPPDPDGAVPLAYLWARVVQCEGPNCGKHYPLIGQPYIARGPNKSVALVYDNARLLSDWPIDVVFGKPKASQLANTARGNSRGQCPYCEYVMTSDQIQAQLSTRRSGADDAFLTSVILRSTEGKKYRAGNHEDVSVARSSALKGYLDDESDSRPRQPFPTWNTRAFTPGLYGIREWGDMHTMRQGHALAYFSTLLTGIPFEIEVEESLRQATLTCLGLVLGRMVDYNANLCRWVPGTTSRSGEFVAAANGGEKRFAWIPDFVEANPISGETGSYSNQLEWVVRVIEKLASSLSNSGTALSSDAWDVPMPDGSVDYIVTDPPYGSAVPYSDLSDFFYVWLRNGLREIHPNMLSPNLTPKGSEAVVNTQSPTDGRGAQTTETYRNRMTAALEHSRTMCKPGGLMVIVFADKTTTEWEALLDALVNAGWVVEASWPVDTERPGRQRSIRSAALASSIHIVCKPREDASGSVANTVGDWRDVLAELPTRIHDWLPRLAREGVVGADAIFACLGPALEIFSRYARVEKASGEQVTLRDYLEYVWAAVSREALGMIFEGASASGFEEDARLTAMWLWTLSTGANGNGSASAGDDDDADDEEPVPSKSNGGAYGLEFDAARKIAQGIGAHLDKLPHLVEIKGSTARLLPVAARARYLLGKEPDAVPTSRRPQVQQLSFFDELLESGGSEWGEDPEVQLGQTVLDRLHQSMLLFAAGRSEALKRFIVAEGVGRDARFWSLAQALSALYPPGTDEKRWVDGVLARKKGFGF